MREASDSESDTEDLVQGRPGNVIKKFPRRVSALKSGDHSSKAKVPEEVEVESADVEYIKTERVVLVQTFLTSWCVRRD